MSSIFETIYQEENHTQQTCVYCNNASTLNGWEGLCDRRCYHGLCDLLESYNSGSEPDERVIVYFTKYPLTTHHFNNEKIKSFINRSK